MPSHEQIVRLAVAGLVFAILFPIVMTSIITSPCKGFPNNTTTITNMPSWCAAATGTVFNVLFPVLVVIAVVLLFVRPSSSGLVQDFKDTYGGFISALQDYADSNAFLSNTNAFVSETEIVGIAIAALLLAILFPIIMASVVAPTTTLWGTAVTTVFQTLFPVLLIVSAVLLFIHREHSGA